LLRTDGALVKRRLTSSAKVVFLQLAQGPLLALPAFNG
jgi:hypothetical protein